MATAGVQSSDGMITPPAESSTPAAQAPTPSTVVAAGAASSVVSTDAGALRAAKAAMDMVADREIKKHMGGAPSKALDKNLVAKVCKQLDFYFSEENLRNDPYLVSCMDPEHYVPISVILGFKRINQLTKDAAVVAAAVQATESCLLDGNHTMVKPSNTSFSERNTIILREIPDGTTEDELRALFAENDGCGRVVSIRSDVQNTWFVTMESEQVAVKSLLALRGAGKFKGKPIRGGLKSNSVARRSEFTGNGSGRNSAGAASPPMSPTAMRAGARRGNGVQAPGVYYMGGGVMGAPVLGAPYGYPVMRPYVPYGYGNPGMMMPNGMDAAGQFNAIQRGGPGANGSGPRNTRNGNGGSNRGRGGGNGGNLGNNRTQKGRNQNRQRRADGNAGAPHRSGRKGSNNIKSAANQATAPSSSTQQQAGAAVQQQQQQQQQQKKKKKSKQGQQTLAPQQSQSQTAGQQQQQQQGDSGISSNGGQSRRRRPGASSGAASSNGAKGNEAGGSKHGSRRSQEEESSSRTSRDRGGRAAKDGARSSNGKNESRKAPRSNINVNSMTAFPTLAGPVSVPAAGAAAASKWGASAAVRAKPASTKLRMANDSVPADRPSQRESSVPASTPGAETPPSAPNTDTGAATTQPREHDRASQVSPPSAAGPSAASLSVSAKLAASSSGGDNASDVAPRAWPESGSTRQGTSKPATAAGAPKLFGWAAAVAKTADKPVQEIVRVPAAPGSRENSGKAKRASAGGAAGGGSASSSDSPAPAGGAHQSGSSSVGASGDAPADAASIAASVVDSMVDKSARDAQQRTARKKMSWADAADEADEQAGRGWATSLAPKTDAAPASAPVSADSTAASAAARPSRGWETPAVTAARQRARASANNSSGETDSAASASSSKATSAWGAASSGPDGSASGQVSFREILLKQERQGRNQPSQPTNSRAAMFASATGAQTAKREAFGRLKERGD